MSIQPKRRGRPPTRRISGHADRIKQSKTQQELHAASMAVLLDTLTTQERTRLLSLAWSRRRSIRAKENAAQRA